MKKKSGDNVIISINELLHMIKHTYLSAEKGTNAKDVSDRLMSIVKHNTIPSPIGIDADLYKMLTILYEVLNKNSATNTNGNN